VAQIARDLGHLVKHVHLRDAIGRNILVVPGDGTVDFTALACALRETGYGRAAVIELEYENARADVVRPDLRRAKELLARDFAAA
jgi:sugar phosphate isomerase/epimerase